MTCNSCHTYSCYVCGIQIAPKNGVKYWHFKGSGSADKNAVCLLYNNGKGGEKEERKRNRQQQKSPKNRKSTRMTRQRDVNNNNEKEE